jgi:LysM repeat protein
MHLNVKSSKFKLNCLHKNLLFVSLLFVLLISSLSCCVLIVQAEDPYRDVVLVDDEATLRTTIADALTPTVIALSADIQLTNNSLDITTGKDIVLTSQGDGWVFKLIGAPGVATITVNDGGVLELAGIQVTHMKGAVGNGVVVQVGGSLTMSEGKITGNIVGRVDDFGGSGGGGVYNEGRFSLFGGVISDNIANWGGGVSNYSGNFTMFGGMISGNTADSGGGIYNYVRSHYYGDEYVCGGVTMFGGVISDNTAHSGGGGINNGGDFTLFDGAILNNNATYGGGVLTGGDFMDFNLCGGVILGNTAIQGGGIYAYRARIKMTGGVISNNTAKDTGGGVCNYGNAYFEMFDGTISDNTANNKGGGIYSYSTFILYTGVISGNTAIQGGGIYNTGTGYETVGHIYLHGGMIANNSAIEGGGIYNRYEPAHQDLLGGITTYDCVIVNNSAVDGGGIYFNRGPSGTYGRDCRVELFGGTFLSNTALNGGGGVWIAVEDLDLLYVYDDVVFSGNVAGAAYERAPIYDELYRARIGAGVVWSEPFTQGYNNYDISGQNIVPLLYTVQPGDSLWLIAKTYDTTIEDLKTLNKLTSDVIYPRQQLLIPRPPNYYVVQFGDTVESIAQKCNTTVHTIKTLNNVPYEKVFVGQELQVWYRVKLGDSLWLIAKTYDTTIEDLKTLNKLTSDTIYLGQRLLISLPPNVYVFHDGDTLESIAQNHNTTVRTILVLNHPYNGVYEGDELKLWYRVQSGDSLWLIAKTYDTTIENLKTLNGLAKDTIYPGQHLLI